MPYADPARARAYRAAKQAKRRRDPEYRAKERARLAAHPEYREAQRAREQAARSTPEAQAERDRRAAEHAARLESDRQERQWQRDHQRKKPLTTEQLKRRANPLCRNMRPE